MDDHGPNGLQVEGREDVGVIAGGVTASRRVIQHAVDAGADALVVHHGLFWSREGAPRLVGWLGERVRLLVKNDVSLIQYHLPLDVHPEVGNNAQILMGIGLKPTESFGERGIGFIGSYRRSVPVETALADLQRVMGGPVVHIAGGPAEVQRVGVVSGAGQRYLEPAAAAGCDLFVTGEASEFVTHVAREVGIHYAWAGHHATERFGVRALLEHLAARFEVETRFVDEENPV